MRHSSKGRERQLRFSIRKFTAGVASVAIASLYFLSASPVSADSHTITVDSVDLNSLTAQERQQVTFGLPPMIDAEHDTCYILVYQPKGSATAVVPVASGDNTSNTVVVTPTGTSAHGTTSSSKSQLMKALPSTGSKELDVAFYGAGASMLALAGYMLWRNKKTGKYLLVAIIAAGGVASSTDVLAAMRLLAPTQNIVVESDNGLYTLTPQEIEGYEYVGYMTKDCELIPADTTDATKHVPTTQAQTVEQGGKLDPAKSISNLVDLPKGTTVAFKTPVDTTTSSEKDAVVVVTYPDGSTEEVPVKVTIAPKAPVTQPTGPTTPTQKDADRHTPVGQSQVVELGQPVNAAGSISNLDKLPEGTTVKFEPTVDTSTPGAKDAVVIVTYPDGSSDRVPVTIGVTETIKISHSETHNPHGHNQTVTVGSAVDATNSISDFSSLIAGTTATFAAPVDTTTPGVKDAVVVVTYPDGSTDIVSVQVTVNAIPRTEDQTVTVGEVPAPERSVPNLDQLPPGTSVAFKEPVDTTTIGDKEAIIVVTYPDGTTEERPVVITVIVDPTPVPVIPNVDTFNPFGQPQTVTQGGTVEARGSIANFDDLIPGTTATFVTPVDTTTPGDKPATVLVSYPDGTSETVDVTVTVLEATKPAPTPDTSAPKLNEPAKTEVVNPTNLTDAEKAKVEEEVKKSNPELPADAEITVGNDGSVSVKVPNRDAATLTPAQTVVEKPDTSAPKLNEPAKTEVVNPTNLTDAEKAKVAEEVKKSNPELPADAEITVGNDGAVTVKVPGKDEATLTPAQTVVEKPDTSAPQLNEPAKTEVVNPTNLTDAEKAKVEEEVKKSNPELPSDTTVTVGNDGTVTVEVPGKDEATLTPAQTVVEKPDTSAPKLNEPAKTEVVNPTNLTDAEKAKVEEEVKKSNPELPSDTTVTVGNDGSVSVKVPNRDAATLTPAQTVVEKPDTSAPKLNEPAKTEVVNPTNLTDAEKAKVEEEVKKSNPELPSDTTVTVGNDGTVTVEVPGKDEATLTPAQTVVEKPDTSAPKLNEPAKTEVVNPTNLTDAEKAKVEEEVKKSNPELPSDTTVTVGNDGSVSVKVPNRDAATLTPAQTVVEKPDTSAPKLNEPAKTEVVNPTNLTDAEKAKVEEEVKKSNPELPSDTTVTVGNDGTVTVEVPGKDEATLTPAQTVVEKPDTSAPTLTEPAKTEVVNPTNLTDAEKAKVEEEVKKANPELPADTTVTVGNDGTVTVEVPGKDEATLTPAQTVVEKPDTSAPQLNEPAKTEVVNPTNLTDAEKAKVEEEVKKSNPELPADAEITVGNDGAVTVKVPGKNEATLTPAQTVVEKPDTSAPQLNEPAKTEVVTPTNLTDAEKAKVEEEVKKANPELPSDTTVTVGNDGSVSVKVPNRDAATLTPAQTVVEKPDTSAPQLNEPAKTEVVNPTNLTDAEKAKVEEEVKKANPELPSDTTVTVGNDGSVSVKVPNRDAATLTPAQTVVEKPDTSAPQLNEPAKTEVVNPTNLTDAEKAKVEEEVKKSNPELPADAEITVGNDGAVTVKVPGKNEATLTPAQTVVEKPDTSAPKLNEPAKTEVVTPTNLTDAEKAKVADEVKKSNPELPADAEITVGNDGAVTVKVPGKDEATLTPAQTVVEKPDTSAPQLNEPAKTEVVTPTNLTDAEKAKVEEEVKKANPELPADTTVTVGNDGSVSVKVPNRDAATLTPAQTITEKPDTSAPNLNEPAKTEVVNPTNLTDAEKAKVEEEVKKANPELPADTTVTVGNDGTVTVEVPGKDEATLTPAQTVVEKPDTSAPQLNEPAKTEVVNPTNLTDAEKAKVEEEVKKSNPELPADAEITVGNDGAVTVKVPGKNEATLTPAQTVVEKPDTSAPQLNEPAKTEVVTPTNLTDAEKAKVEEEVKKANPELPSDTTVTVGNDGSVSVKVPNRDAATLTPAQTITEKPDTSAPNLNEPAKTEVVNPTNLTDAEKAKVEEEVKKANPELPSDTTVTVGNDGTVTVEVPGKDEATLTPAQTVVEKPDTSAPQLNEPAKTEVVNPTNLTDAEKAKIADEVKKANPELPADAEITVDKDGTVTIKVRGKEAAILKPAQTVVEKPDTSAPKLNEPAKTEVVNPTNLTDAEKAKVEDEVKKANPELPADAEITVGNDGAVTVKVPGKDEATLTPAQTVVEKSTAPTVNPIDSDDTAITGTGIPGATVSVTVPGSDEPKTATVTPEGTWSIPVETPLPAGTVVPATQKDGDKNPSSPVDTTVTAAPVTQPTNTPPTVTAPTRVVAWNGEAMAPITVEASDPDANDSIQTAALGGRAVTGLTAQATNGTVTISGTPNTRPGSYPNRTVVVTDQNGGRTTSSPFEVIVLDATATAVTPADQTPPTEQAILDAVTVQGNTANLPVDKKLPEGTKIPTAEEIRNGASNEVPVIVTVDGQSKTVNVPINYPAPEQPLTLTDPAVTPVNNTRALTEDEKAKVKEAIKAANPSLNLTDDQIVVNDNGATTVTVPGKTPASLTPAQTVKASEASTNNPTATPLSVEQGSATITPEQIQNQVSGLPAGARITNVGTIPSTETPTTGAVDVPVTVTYADGSTDTVNVPVTVTAKATPAFDPEKPVDIQGIDLQFSALVDTNYSARTESGIAPDRITTSAHSISWSGSRGPSLSLEKDQPTGGKLDETIEVGTFIHANNQSNTSDNSVTEVHLLANLNMMIEGQQVNLEYRNLGRIYVLEKLGSARGQVDYFVFEPLVQTVSVNGNTYYIYVSKFSGSGTATASEVKEAMEANQNNSNRLVQRLVPEELPTLFADSNRVNSSYFAASPEQDTNDFKVGVIVTKTKPAFMKP